MYLYCTSRIIFGLDALLKADVRRQAVLDASVEENLRWVGIQGSGGKEQPESTGGRENMDCPSRGSGGSPSSRASDPSPALGA